MRRTIWKPLLFVLLAAVLYSCTSEKPGSPESPAENDSAVPESASELPTEGNQTPEEQAGPDAGEPVTAVAVIDSLYQETDDAGQALAALEAAGVEQMDEDSRLVYAILLRNEGRIDEARSELDSLVSENPDDAPAWFHLALLEHGAGDEDARDTALDRALEADPELAEAHAFRGELAIAESRWSEAESSLKKSLEFDPENVESIVGLAWVFAKTDRRKNSLPLLDRAVELDPEYVYARVDRSRVLVAEGEYNLAEDDLDVAVEQEPDVPWHYLDRARIRLRYFKDYEGARSDLEMVEKLDPGNFFALVYLAGLHDEERRFASALDYYRQVVEARPNYVWAYMPLGKYAWMEGRYEDAARWYAKAAAEDPEEFSYALMAGLSLARIGRKSEGDRILADLIRNYERTDVEYEVIRFCTEQGSDFYAVNALNKEENDTLRERLWFYMGAVYESEGNEIGAGSVFERLAPRRGETEYDLAWAALNGMGG